MIQSDSGIVLGAISYKHSARIVRVFSKERGVMSFYVHSVKSKKWLSYFQPLQLIEFTFQKNSKSDLNTFKEIGIATFHHNIHEDIKKIAIAFFIAEILNLTIKEQEKNTALYSFIQSSIKQLNDADQLKYYPISFLMSYLKILGISPLIHENGNYFNIHTGTLQIKKDELQCLTENDTKAFLNAYNKEYLKINSKDTRQLLINILAYYTYHLPNFNKVKSLEVLKTVFY